MSKAVPELRVIEQDVGRNVVTVEDRETGVTVLVVSPKQSFDVAVKGIMRVCPGLTLTQVQDLVRNNCPNIREMNERLGASQSIPRVEAAPKAGTITPTANHVCAPPHPRAPRWARIVAVATPALIGGILAAQWLHLEGPWTDRHSTVGAPGPAQHAVEQPYKTAAFKLIATSGGIQCAAMGQFEAKCVDVDGKAMMSEASIGTSTAFSFTYDSKKIGFRIFPAEDAAAAWSGEDANRAMFGNVSRQGRIVFWGSDKERLSRWEKRISASPLPDDGNGDPR
ncbi:hypothetical protein ABT024_05300 [Streptomyces sp. NPDC002812]|uniref:hypothetical protein n=1 Tax=Streptomyces sp. NPDC002812 TaxID=3154434 RepID=UPI00332D51E0